MLLASGKVGNVEIISSDVPSDLAAQAVTAAKLIKFEPAQVGGVPIDKSVTVEYTFSIYFDEDSPELQKPAEITKKPLPEFPKVKGSQQFVGKVTIKVILNAN
jgi:TonB family protein